MEFQLALEGGDYLGLIKFFREQKHLEMFLDGDIYCNTPEYYRLADAPGISDRNESCNICVRKSRNDLPLEMEVAGKYAGEATDFILRSGRAEGWVQCWAILNVPKNDLEFDILTESFNRLKNEFGPYYLHVKPEQSHEMLSRMTSSLDINIEAKQVAYEEYPILGDSIFKKSNRFSYQNEYRIVFSECDTNNIDARIFKVNKGFRDLLDVNPKIEITGKSEKTEFEFLLEYAQ